MRSEADAPSGEVEAPDLTDEIFSDDDAQTTGFDELLGHLLGGGTDILADAGLSRFCPQRLAAIQHGAEARVTEGLHGLQAMSQLLAVALEQPQAELPAPVLASVAWHFHAQLHAMERWQALAANAAGLRGNRVAANDIARIYVAWARTVGEWPEPG